MNEEKIISKTKACKKQSRMTPFLHNDGYVSFLIKLTTKETDEPWRMDFELYEVVSWKCDDKKTPSETELYLEGVIKRDGCSHIWFGAKDVNDQRSGYLHLCGKTYWRRHADVMLKIFELAEKTISEYDESF
ncbi:MAG: hypothetical protein GY821_12830 [Gammaproteobacteria bacterium]|nr:hypothetical protein [Gammaproteobacteria bacterium]